MVQLRGGKIKEELGIGINERKDYNFIEAWRAEDICSFYAYK